MQTAAILPGLEPSYGLIVLIFLAVALYLSSGFAAATFSEMKERNRTGHFIGGLLLPFIYPAILYYLFPRLPEPVDERAARFDKEGSLKLNLSEKLTQKYMEKTGEGYVPSVIDEIAKETGEKNTEAFPETQEATIAFNRGIISDIASDEEGNFRGPFIIGLNDGRYIEALRILDAYDDFFELEMVAADDKASKIRLPYAKIISCELKDDWIEDDNDEE
jgi:hypothetical protein